MNELQNVEALRYATRERGAADSVCIQHEHARTASPEGDLSVSCLQNRGCILECV